MAPGCMGDLGKGVGSQGRSRRELQGVCGARPALEPLFAAPGLSSLPGSFKTGLHFTFQGPLGRVLGAAAFPPPLLPLPPQSPLPDSPVPLPSHLFNPFTSKIRLPWASSPAPGSSAPLPSHGQLQTGPHLHLVRLGLGLG